VRWDWSDNDDDCVADIAALGLALRRPSDMTNPNGEVV